VVDSSCFLVSARSSFYSVFVRFWTQVGPKSRGGSSLVLSQRVSVQSLSEGAEADQIRSVAASHRRVFVVR
jgi:hypothetical protein